MRKGKERIGVLKRWQDDGLTLLEGKTTFLHQFSGHFPTYGHISIQCLMSHVPSKIPVAPDY